MPHYYVEVLLFGLYFFVQTMVIKVDLARETL